VFAGTEKVGQHLKMEKPGGYPEDMFIDAVRIAFMYILTVS